ncbi:MAG: GatB/YqeY domain-containing protein [Zetaproteobacteria bacterium]|nr:MAG: GatB/YqeY domain-containing protein [Zetaproteobacteria bacterium]
MLQRITEAMKEAMKAGDKPRLSAIRMLRAALKEQEIAAGRPLEEDEVVRVIGRLIKQRKDAAEQYRKGGRDDLADKELFEAEVLAQWLPRQLDDRELAAAVDRACTELGADSIRAMGRVMGRLQQELAGRADMRRVSELVKARLTGGD